MKDMLRQRDTWWNASPGSMSRVAGKFLYFVLDIPALSRALD